MKSTLKKLLPLIDIIASPLTFLSAAFLLVVRRISLTTFSKMKISKKIFHVLGIFPILDHYYEPLFNPKHLKHDLSKDRTLPGLDLNVSEQLEILKQFRFNDELTDLPLKKKSDTEYYFHNEVFEAGDAEYLYNIIRLKKPRKTLEIGSGFSTLMAKEAIQANQKENSDYKCQLTCIEPYERDWLEKLDVELIRQPIEQVDKNIFSELEAGDILFIDSTHIIRPQGDVLYLYSEILPIIKSGVLVHVHDIYTPKDYPKEVIVNQNRFWNEQYLLEAFLAFNKEFRVIGALNYLKHNRFNELAAKCPVLKNEPDAEPGSFWLMRN